MPLILCIETSTQTCSVALSEAGHICSFKEIGGAYTHAENLTLFMEEVLATGGHQLKDLDAVAVGKGPGSYTGLRIGVSAAKGLCYAIDKPLIAIGTLQALLGACPKDYPNDTLYCPMLDARRMEVYTAVYDSDGKELEAVSARIIDANAFSLLLEKNKIVFFGDGAAKCKSVLQHPNALFVEDIFPSARYIAPLAQHAWEKKKFEDVAYFEPFYLKDFLAGR